MKIPIENRKRLDECLDNLKADHAAIVKMIGGGDMDFCTMLVHIQGKMQVVIQEFEDLLYPPVDERACPVGISPVDIYLLETGGKKVRLVEGD